MSGVTSTQQVMSREGGMKWVLEFLGPWLSAGWSCCSSHCYFIHSLTKALTYTHAYTRQGQAADGRQVDESTRTCQHASAPRWPKDHSIGILRPRDSPPHGNASNPRARFGGPAMTRKKLYKVLDARGAPMHGGHGKWSLPRGGKPGKWRPPDPGPIKACRNRYHLRGRVDIGLWLGRGGVFVYEGGGRGQRP